MSGFKLNFESQFDILHAIFCFNISLYWYCSWHTKKKKGNDQEFNQYLINNCDSFWIMRVSVLVYGLQTALSLAQSVPWAPQKWAQVACASAETVLRIQRLLMQTRKILTAGIHRLIRILFVSNRFNVCFGPQGFGRAGQKGNLFSGQGLITRTVYFFIVI